MKQRAPTMLLFVLLLGLVGQDMLVSLQLADLRMARLLRGLHLLVLGLSLVAVLRSAPGRMDVRVALVSPVVLDVLAVHASSRGAMAPGWLAAAFAVTGIIPALMLWHGRRARGGNQR